MRGPAADSDPHRFILLLYVPGCISKERGVVEFSRAYLVMRSAIAVKWFGDAVQGAQFKTENEPAARDAFGRSVKSAGFARLKATHASVELAPCSRLPSRKVNHADGNDACNKCSTPGCGLAYIQLRMGGRLPGELRPGDELMAYWCPDGETCERAAEGS